MVIFRRFDLMKNCVGTPKRMSRRRRKELTAANMATRHEWTRVSNGAAKMSSIELLEYAKSRNIFTVYVGGEESDNKQK